MPKKKFKSHEEYLAHRRANSNLERRLSGIKLGKNSIRDAENFIKEKKTTKSHGKVVKQDDLIEYFEMLGHNRPREKASNVMKHEKFSLINFIISENPAKIHKTPKDRKLALNKAVRKASKKRRSKVLSFWLMGDFLPYWQKKVNELSYRDVKFNLTPEYMAELTQKQNGCCYYTGIPIRPFTNELIARGFENKLSQLSVDKLDPKKGYTKGNVVVCSMFINKMKEQSDLGQFKSIISLISNRLMIPKNYESAEFKKIKNKISKKYIHQTHKFLKKIKKLYAKRLIETAKKFEGNVIINKGKLEKTN
jgi:hypothetical protein